MRKNKLIYMRVSQNIPHIALVSHLMKWIFIASIVGLLSGSVSAFFLKSLDFVTQIRLEHPSILYLLPIGGAFVSFLYYKYGKTSSKGNDLIIEQINNRNDDIPYRMGFLALFGALVTHLLGGSVGREGTAVQMSGSITEAIGKLFKLDKADQRIILMSGISSGFASIFGTPIAGTLFGMEVVMLGSIHNEALIACFIASFVGKLVTSAWGIQYSSYPSIQIPELSFFLIIKILVASIIFGLVSIFFCELTHGLKHLLSKYLKNPMLKSAVGGIIIILLVNLLGTRDYIGLGSSLIVEAFQGSVSKLAFFWKALFTSITLGSGFQGGEVTPLFIIGASVGNSLSGLLQLSPIFLASLGFVSVFAGAANTPITCFILGIELFGAEGAIYFFIACIVSYLFSGHHGIYTTQRIGEAKSKLLRNKKGATLSDANRT